MLYLRRMLLLCLLLHRHCCAHLVFTAITASTALTALITPTAFTALTALTVQSAAVGVKRNGPASGNGADDSFATIGEARMQLTSPEDVARLARTIEVPPFLVTAT